MWYALSVVARSLAEGFLASYAIAANRGNDW